MSTYTRPDKFIPVNISSDPSAYLEYVQKRADLSAQGEAAIKLQYKQYLDLDLTHDSNKDKLNNFLTETSKQISKMTNTDLSDMDNVKKVLGTFDPLTQDNQYESVLYDNKYTKHYRSQLAIADNMKKAVDKKGNVGKGYNNANYEELMHHYNKFQSGDPQNQQTWGDLHTYQPYFDYTEAQRERALEFMKLPDEYEMETLQPETGLTQKIKYKGKSADQIRMYLENTASAQEKSQMALEGRVEARRIDDSQYIRMFTDTATENIKNLTTRLKDIDAFKTEDGKKLTAQEVKVRKDQIEAQIKKEQLQLEDLKNPDKVKEYINNKEDNYSNYYMNSRMSRISMALENKRPDITYGTNQAYVSMLNRNANFQMLERKLAHEQALADRKFGLEVEKLKIEAFKAGYDPVTGKAVDNNNLGFGKEQPVAIPDNEADLIKSIEKNEQTMDSQVNSFLTKNAKDAYTLIGATDVSSDNNRDALKAIISIKDRYMKGDSQLESLLNAPINTLSSRDLATRRIVENLKLEDATVIKVNSYYERKKNLQQTAKKGILSEFQKQGITIDDVNGALNESSKGVDTYEQMVGSFLGPAVGEMVNIGNRINNLFKTKYGEMSSLDEVAERAATDPEFAKTISDNLSNKLNNKFSIKSLGSSLVGIGAGVLTNNPTIASNIDAFGREKSIKLNLEGYAKQAYSQLAQDYITSGMEMVYSKPLSAETALDKERSSRFERMVTNIYGNPTYKEIIGDEIKPELVKTIHERDGMYVVEGYNKGVINKSTGKIVPAQDAEIISVEIPVPSLTVTDAENKEYVSAMAMSPTGSIKKSFTSPISNLKYNYSVQTFSGTPYVPYSEGNDLIVATLELDKDNIIKLPATYTDPKSAMKGVEEHLKTLETIVAQNVIAEHIQEGLRVTKGDKNAAKKYVVEKYQDTIQQIITERLEKMKQTGAIQESLDMPNPNITPGQQLFHDMINSL